MGERNATIYDEISMADLTRVLKLYVDAHKNNDFDEIFKLEKRYPLLTSEDLGAYLQNFLKVFNFTNDELDELLKARMLGKI